jgi:serine/threonine protein kinase
MQILCQPAQANNPFVVRFYYSFSSPEKLFLVMEYCEGGDLASVLQVRFSGLTWIQGLALHIAWEGSG